MKYGFVYMTTNLVNGRKYVGQHKRAQDKDDPDDSWYFGSGLLLHRAISKYGVENFSREILYECDSQRDLDDKEITVIELLRADRDPTFYNISKGGSGSWMRNGAHILQDPIVKESHRQSMNNPKVIARMLGDNNPMRRIRDLRERTRIRVVNDNPMKNPNVRMKVAETLREYSRRPDVRQRMISDNPVHKPGVREKISATNRVVMNTPEVKKKLIESRRRALNDPEHLRRFRESREGSKNPAYGTLWINDGISNKRVKEEEFERFYKCEGFKKGRLSKSYGPRKDK